MLLPPPPNFWEVYNNSNLVNNEVFKKLATKFASMKYVLLKPCLIVISHAKPLYSTSWLFAIYDYRVQSVAAPERGSFPPNTNFLELIDWESLIEKISNFR